MKILHTSDWHIGKIVNEFSQIEDQQFFLDGLCALIKCENPDVLLISGDLYDRSIPPVEAVKLLDAYLTKIVTELKVPVLAISGNHDSASRLSFGTKLLEEKGLFIKTEHKKQMDKLTLKDNFGEVNFYFLPFVESVYLKQDFKDESFKTLNDVFNHYIEYNANFIDASSRNVLLAHGFFSKISDEKRENTQIFSESETNVGTCDLIDAATVSATFDYTALGHLHAPQNVCENVRYSGSILKYSDSETTQNKSVTMVELKEKGNISVTECKIPTLRDMQRVKGTIDELLQHPMCDDYVFAVLTDADFVTDASRKLRSVFPSLMGVRQLCLEKETQVSKITLKQIREKSTEELFSDFYSSISGTPLTDEQTEIMSKIISDSKRGEEQ